MDESKLDITPLLGTREGYAGSGGEDVALKWQAVQPG